ncbi:MAG: hypothetical protein ACRDH6_08770 [Actinomycetota bacterium]
MREQSRSRGRLAAVVLAAGLLAGIVVSVAAAGTGALACQTDPAGECQALTQTLAIRVGVVAGAATILMLLLVAGLLRMVAQDEERRLTIARERTRGG